MLIYTHAAIERALRQITDEPIKTWQCPCAEVDCSAFVLYARCIVPDESPSPGFCFLANVTFDDNLESGFGILFVRNVEDFNLEPRRAEMSESKATEMAQNGWVSVETGLDSRDCLLMQRWLSLGLREVILNA